MSEVFANAASTTLSATTTTTATSLTVASSAGFPTPASGDYFVARIEPASPNGTYELVKVTAVSGTTWTVARAYDGTSGIAWASGANVTAVVAAATMTNLLQRSYEWTGDLPSIGWLWQLHANFTAGTSSPEAIVFSSSTSGTKRRVWWWNENLVPRCAASRADEVPFKVHGFDGGTQTSDLIQFWSKWTSGTLLYGIDASGLPRLGANRVQGAHTIVLTSAASVPAGTPTGTVIVRTA